MNQVTLLGNLVKDHNVKETTTKVLRNTIAVKREFKKDESDFINVIAFNKTAELIEKYTQKGSKILICGRIQVSSYDAQDGSKKYSPCIPRYTVSRTSPLRFNAQSSSYAKILYNLISLCTKYKFLLVIY